jgi:hypothetical protein
VRATLKLAARLFAVLAALALYVSALVLPFVLRVLATFG